MEHARKTRHVEIFLAVLYVLVIMGLLEIKLTAKVFLFTTVLASVLAFPWLIVERMQKYRSVSTWSMLEGNSDFGSVLINPAITFSRDVIIM